PRIDGPSRSAAGTFATIKLRHYPAPRAPRSPRAMRGGFRFACQAYNLSYFTGTPDNAAAGVTVALRSVPALGAARCVHARSGLPAGECDRGRDLLSMI